MLYRLQPSEVIVAAMLVYVLESSLRVWTEQMQEGRSEEATTHK